MVGEVHLGIVRKGKIMKLSLIALCSMLVGCINNTSGNPAPSADPVPVSGNIPPATDEEPPLCGRTYHIAMVLNGENISLDVPVFCNLEGDTYRGDPPPDIKNLNHSEKVSNPAIRQRLSIR